MTWLKGGSKGQNISKKRDITPSGSITVEEGDSTALAVIPIQRDGITEFADMTKETEGPRTRSDHAHTPTSTAQSRVTSPTPRDASPLAIEAHPSSQTLQLTTLKPYDDPEEYILKEDDLESGADSDRLPEKTTYISAANGKKKGVKLRMAALNILKMKSSSFLRKPQDGQEQQGVSRRRDSVVLSPTCVLVVFPMLNSHILGSAISQQYRRDDSQSPKQHCCCCGDCVWLGPASARASSETPAIRFVKPTAISCGRINPGR